MIYKQLYENKFNRHHSESKLMNNYFHNNNSAEATSDEADVVVDNILFDAVSTSNISGAVHNHRKSGSSGGVGLDIPK
jgi:hypothetical protein